MFPKRCGKPVKTTLPRTLLTSPPTSPLYFLLLPFCLCLLPPASCLLPPALYFTRSCASNSGKLLFRWTSVSASLRAQTIDCLPPEGRTAPGVDCLPPPTPRGTNWLRSADSADHFPAAAGPRAAAALLRRSGTFEASVSLQTTSAGFCKVANPTSLKFLQDEAEFSPKSLQSASENQY